MTTAITKEQARAVYDEIGHVIKNVLKRHGMELTGETLNYGDEFKFTVKAIGVAMSGEGINMSSPDVIAYERHGYSSYVGNEYKSLVAPIGTKFKNTDGKEYVFAGVRARGKSKILGLRNGQMCAFSDAYIDVINKATQQ